MPDTMVKHAMVKRRVVDSIDATAGPSFEGGLC
jgi:hypothetical protein